MSKSLFVDFRDDGFWALDVVSSVFLKHLVDAATSYLQDHDDHWLADAIENWRFNAVCGDCGLFLDDAWSADQIATFTQLARAACESMSKRTEIPAGEIESWQMIEGKDGRCYARGFPFITTTSAIRFGGAIISLVNGTLPKPPPGTWWFFSTEEAEPTVRKRRD